MEHKYKVGDKVIMHGVVDEVDREDDEAPYLIRFDNIDGKNDFDTVWANEKVLNVDIEKTYEDVEKGCKAFLQWLRARNEIQAIAKLTKLILSDSKEINTQVGAWAAVGT